MVNPYLSDTMITTPDAFFGRRLELRRIFDRLQSMQCTSIVGEPLIGKSSLLYAVKQREIQARHQCDRFGDYIFVYLDMRRYEKMPPEKLLAVVLQSIAKESSSQLEFDIGMDIDYDFFSQQMEYLSRLGLRIALLMDHFDEVRSNDSLDTRFFDFLRSFADGARIVYVTASRNDLNILGRSDQVSSPFFNIFSPIRLGLMPEEEIRELILAPAKSQGRSFEADLPTVLEWAGPHPYYAQLACRCLWDAGPADERHAQGNSLRKAKEQFQEVAQKYFEYAWKRLGEAEQKTLVELAKGWKIEESSAEGLVKKYILVRRDGKLDFASYGFREFAASKSIVIKGPDTTSIPPSVPVPPIEPQSATTTPGTQTVPAGPDLTKVMVLISGFVVLILGALAGVAYLLRGSSLLVLIVFAMALLILLTAFGFAGLLVQAVRETTLFQIFASVLQKIPGLDVFLGPLGRQD